VCELNHWTIGALTIQEDHIHLFVSAPPAVSPSQIAHTLKAIIARQVVKHYPTVKKQLWDGSFRSRSFYVGAVGDVTEATVKSYIESGQPTPGSERAHVSNGVEASPLNGEVVHYSRDL
jgi:putative transposase